MPRAPSGALPTTAAVASGRAVHADAGSGRRIAAVPAPPATAAVTPEHHAEPAAERKTEPPASSGATAGLPGSEAVESHASAAGDANEVTENAAAVTAAESPAAAGARGDDGDVKPANPAASGELADDAVSAAAAAAPSAPAAPAAAVPAQEEGVREETSTAVAVPASPRLSLDDATAADPSVVLQGMSRGSLAAVVVVAIVAHVVVIGITSMNHISLCLKYGTFWPKPIMKREREEAEKRKMEERVEADRQKALAEQEKAAAAKDKKAAEPDAPAGKKEGGNDTAAPRAKTPVEKRLEEKSTERPKESTVNLDDVKTLE